MKRTTALVPFVTLLALTTLGSLLPGGPVGTAYAQDREKKEERRVLRASDIDSMSVSEAYRAAAREKRHESMEFLKQIIAERNPQGEQRAEMMLRLADLYFEEGRDIRLSEDKEHNDAVDKCFNTPGCPMDSIKADYTESSKWQQKSIKLYRQILDSYPEYARADEATFYLASALADTEDADNAVKEWLRLVKMYPNSRYVPDSYVLIGEYYFDRNNAYKALQAYQHATTYRDSDKYPFAMYKLAWCYYNVGEYQKAIETMKAVVAIAAPTGEPDKARLTLQDEALKDLVRFFADAGEMEDAYVYFTKLGKRELISQMLKRLASTYFEQGKFDQCITTYRRLISEDPQGATAPEYQNEIIAAYQKMGKKEDTIAAIEQLQKTYGKNSAWARANAANPDAVKAASEYLEKNLRTVAINYHDEAKKLGTGKAATEAYALAYKAYTVYLTEFPDSKYSYDVRYAFGELLYKIKKYDEAYVQYMKVVEIDPKGQHSRFCAESAIFAADEMVKKEGKTASPDPGNKTQAMPLSEWETNLIKACDQYSKIFSTEKNTKNIIYKSAYILYNKNQFKEASDRFRTVIAMDPASTEAEQAANLILDSFNLVEDWKNLKEVSKAFYDQSGLGSANFKKEVYNVYERSSFKLIEGNFASSQDYGAAADAYMAFFGEFPNSEVADLALNNSAAYFHKVGAVAKAMGARQTLIEKFPKSKYYNSQVAALGFDFETIADFGEAARWYEKLFSLTAPSKDKKVEGAEGDSTKEAIYSAAIFRRALGEWEQSVKDYSQFLQAYPDDSRVPDVTLTIAKIYEDNQKWTQAGGVYLTFYTKPPTGASVDQVYFARLHYGLSLEKQGGQDAKLDKHWKETVSQFESDRAKGVDLGASVEFVAEIMFKLAQPQLNNFMNMSITGPSGKVSRKQEDEALTKSLVAKAKALQAVEITFSKIVETGAGEWGLAALIKLGQAYENMGESLRASYVPSYLTEDQREIYAMTLEDKVFPQVEKAVNAYSLALQKSFELSLYNDNTAFATRRLAELRPNDFPALEEKLITPRYTTRSVVERSFEEKL